MSRAYITAAQLEDAGACSDQVALFRATFGERTIVTVKKAEKVAGLFEWESAICLLDDEGRAEYERVEAPALAEYERVNALAWAEYDRVNALAWAEYKRVNAPAWAEYKRVNAPAWAEYKRVNALAWAEYERIRATAWASAYIATVGRIA